MPTTTKPDGETGWSKEWPTVDDYYFRRINQWDIPSLVRIVGDTCRFTDGSSEGRHECYEFLGPVTASDFEQLIRLREIASRAVDVLNVVNAHMKLDYAKQVADELREALAHKGGES